jgi:hypothetical protein
MGLGLLNGQPNTYLTREWYSTAERLAMWIRNELPSFSGSVPMKYTEAVVKALRGQHVPEATGRDAFRILEILEIRFEWPITMSEFKPASFAAPAPAANKIGVVPPQLRGMTGAESYDSKVRAIEHYEHKYLLAIHTNDPGLAIAILKAAFALVINLLEGHGEAKQMKKNEVLVEWEEFNAAVDQALRRAPTLQNHFRYLSRAEVYQLRNAPSPRSLEETINQLAGRITARTIPPARRSSGR